MVTISNGHTRQCKDSKSGIKKLYLLTYEKHPRRLIVVDGLKLVSFPFSELFVYETANRLAFTETQKENEGGKYYEQKISLDFRGVLVQDNFETFASNYLRCIIEDNNGKLRLLGAYNGLECNKVNYSTGSGRSDLNGFKLELSGIESNPAFFIDSLQDVGFDILEDGFLLTEDGINVVTENNILIKL